MNKQENQLFLELCRFESFDRELIASLLPESAGAEVLGQLFFNRMQGVAYRVLEHGELLEKVHREFCTSLKNAYIQNIEKNKSYFKCLHLLSGVLSEFGGKYAALKGARLCFEYSPGCRTSNDIDILVRGRDVTQIGKALSEAGFRQGRIRNDRFEPASRGEIVESRMLRGEIVPYICEVGLPYMKFLEVDVNFSTDYKNGSADVVSEILSRSVSFSIGKRSVPVPDRHDFFIHLCAHLYKEMTTLPWVRMRRDMSMYKFCDIYMLMRRFNSGDADFMFSRARELGLEEVCSCAVIWTDDLLPVKNSRAVSMARELIRGKEDLLRTVVSPADKSAFVYKETDTAARFFSSDRASLLTEVRS